MNRLAGIAFDLLTHLAGVPAHHRDVPDSVRIVHDLFEQSPGGGRRASVKHQGATAGLHGVWLQPIPGLAAAEDGLDPGVHLEQIEGLGQV
jgi:hypothetical protein